MHTRTAVLTIAVAALLTGAVGAASAEQQRLVDPQGDVWVATDDGSSVPAPGSTQGDLTRAKTSYRGSAIVVRLKFVDLARQGSYAQYAVVLQGHRDLLTREVVVEAGPGRWAGRARVYQPHGDLVTSCTAAHAIDYGTDTVRVRVDRSCLAKPGSVRANINVYRVDETGVVFADNPHDALEYSDAWTPWVRRTA